MLDSVLKYVSLITVAGAAIGFVIGLIKYVDQRNREERTKRFELYHNLVRSISGAGDKASDSIPLTQQLAAVYELQHFEEYSYASVPILEHLLTDLASNTPPPGLISAIQSTIQTLRNGT